MADVQVSPGMGVSLILIVPVPCEPLYPPAAIRNCCPGKLWNEIDD
jgi:hypothetical protein